MISKRKLASLFFEIIVGEVAVKAQQVKPWTPVSPSALDTSRELRVNNNWSVCHCQREQTHRRCKLFPHYKRFPLNLKINKPIVRFI